MHRLAAELDYQPNQLATSLAHSRTKTIGVLMPSLSYHFYSALLNSIEEAAVQAGYSVLVCQANESPLREITNIQNLMRSQAEGFLIALSRDTNSCERIERLNRKNFPLVLFDRCANGIAASKVISDNEAAAFNATEHLIEQGCQRVGFLGATWLSAASGWPATRRPSPWPSTACTRAPSTSCTATSLKKMPSSATSRLPLCKRRASPA
ncbi:LacI family DNA-binding transcriptional regulator [Hymenobacter terricola]|uniref:LacI family DNA-binding transcriptional regulator n=1 Tax=Hymenobacter terricola TaxID=2819236 RepID=UPI00293D53A0|nr:LacI family DNA-binding transcriptional regulator [Hymenobacter terricola]